MASRVVNTSALSRPTVSSQSILKKATSLYIKCVFLYLCDGSVLMLATLQTIGATKASCKGLYHNKNIQKIVNTMWFAKKQDEGVIYYEYFKPFHVVTLALVLTGVFACSLPPHFVQCSHIAVTRWNVCLTSGLPASRPKSSSLWWTISLYMRLISSVCRTLTGTRRSTSFWIRFV